MYGHQGMLAGGVEEIRVGMRQAGGTVRTTPCLIVAVDNL